MLQVALDQLPLPEILESVLIYFHSVFVYLHNAVPPRRDLGPELEAAMEVGLLQPQEGLDDDLEAVIFAMGERKGQQSIRLFKVLEFRLLSSERGPCNLSIPLLLNK